MITGILIAVVAIGLGFYILFQLEPVDNGDTDVDW
jgi:hypothetical protein